MTYKFWTNVAVDMASAAGIGAAIPVTAITKASPAVVSYTGADPANGNYVLMTSSGMTQTNRRIYRVANVNAAGNTFELEGVDSTAYSTFTSGSFQVLSFDKSFATLSEPQASGGEPITEDTTLIHDPQDTEAVVSTSAQGYGFTSKWLPNDAALIEAQAAFIARTPRPVRVTFADGSKFCFSGTVSAPMAPAASGRKVTTPINFRLEASGTSFAT